jgi:SAM-dependent methyltransferase
VLFAGLPSGGVEIPGTRRLCLQIENMVAKRSYREDPLTPGEREELAEDLIAFCDRELDLLGDIRGLDVLYAGGSSPLWIEGLSQRVGEGGNVTAINQDPERVEEAQLSLGETELSAPVNLLAGDIFEMPFGPVTFDLVYSSGLLHELDVRENSVQEALAALHRVARSGGRVATSDFVDSEPAVQLEDERLEADLMWEAYGRELYGIGPPERLVSLHEEFLTDVGWRISPPRTIRHLEKLVLAEDEPAELASLPPATARSFRVRLEALRDRILSEGYTRPATLYVEGVVSDG